MSDNELLEKAALEAIRSAAERLNVDPLRLARFLDHARIAEVLAALGRQETMANERAATASLTREYLDFLEEEVRLCRDELKASGRGRRD